MTDETRDMIRDALRTQNERIGEVRDTAAESIRIARANQVNIARLSEHVQGLEGEVSKASKSIQDLTKAISENGLSSRVGHCEFNHRQLAGDFAECRRRSRKLIGWFVGVLTVIFTALLLAFGKEVFIRIFGAD